VTVQGAPVLVVDDDPGIRSLVVDYLGGEGFRVAAVGTAAEMRERMAREPAGVVLLDVLLPDGDGLSLLRELKERHGAAVILLTVKGEVVDRVVGLEMGADDYVAKPFHLRELAARVRSVLRRAGAAEPPPGDAATGGSFVFADWRLDCEARELRDPGGRLVPLTSGEYELLHAFLRAPNRVMSRDQLLESTRGRRHEPYDRAIDVQVGRLRRKIETDPSQPSLIKTVRGAGYILAARVEAR
jgi:two-component system, OmpR family, response regulator